MDLLAFPFSVQSENGKVERVNVENEIKFNIDENKLNLASLENIKKMYLRKKSKIDNTLEQMKFENLFAKKSNMMARHRWERSPPPSVRPFWARSLRLHGWM